MSHVINSTDTLELTSHAPDYNDAQSLPRVVPAPQHGLSLWGRLTSMLKLSLRRQRQRAILRYPQPEMPLDILAREHPYLYMRAMIG